MATLQEIESHYSLNDLADLHEAMDVNAEAEAHSMEDNK
jgi:hypothetical protein